jgi:hypothetical protein
MVYPDWLTISQMKKLGLFDNIEYKYIKNIIENDEDEIDIEIEDIKSNNEWTCKTRFTFKISQGKVYVWDTEDTYKTFVVEQVYNGSSPYAYMMMDLYGWDENEEDEEEEEEEEEEKEN